jgi:hypothetical protein
MRRSWYLLGLLLFFVTGICCGQEKVPVQPLTISAPLQTEAPFRTLFGPRLCDSSGAVYLRYFPEKGAGVFSSPITKVLSDGTSKTIPVGQLPNVESELGAFAVGTDKLFEVLLVHASNSTAPGSYYAEFDQNGDLVTRSSIDLEGTFIPSTLVPLPTGDFFASGTQIFAGKDKGSEQRRTIAAIFSPDGRIKHLIRKVSKDASNYESQSQEDLNGQAYLAEDERLYVFRASNPVQVEVLSQSGSVERTMKLAAPLPKATPTAMFVSGGRIIVSWAFPNDHPDSEGRLALYDTQRGSLLRLYRPDFAGSPVCFEDGKDLKILTVVKSGFFGLSTVELR